MKLYGFPHSRSFRVLWALEEAGAEYEYHVLNLGKGEGRKLPYTTINPGGKVPALEDDGLTLTESAAICTYVGDQYPDSGLVPEAGTPARALYNRWCFFAISELEQPLWTLGKHRFAIPEKYRVPAIKETARWEFTIACDLLVKGLDNHPYMLGENFTAADILVAHTLSWARATNVPTEQPDLDGYLDQMMKRPAYLRAREKEDSLNSRKP